MDGVLGIIKEKPYSIARVSYIHLEANTCHVFLHCSKDGLSLGQWERLKASVCALRIHFLRSPDKKALIENDFRDHPYFSAETLKYNEITLNVSLFISM